MLNDIITRPAQLTIKQFNWLLAYNVIPDQISKAIRRSSLIKVKTNLIGLLQNISLPAAITIKQIVFNARCPALRLNLVSQKTTQLNFIITQIRAYTTNSFIKSLNLPELILACWFLNTSNYPMPTPTPCLAPQILLRSAQYPKAKEKP